MEKTTKRMYIFKNTARTRQMENKVSLYFMQQVNELKAK